MIPHQNDLVDEHRLTREAGQELSRELSGQIKRNQEGRLTKIEQGKKEKDQETRRELEIEAKRMRGEVEKFEKEAKRLASGYRRN